MHKGVLRSSRGHCIEKSFWGQAPRPKLSANYLWKRIILAYTCFPLAQIWNNGAPSGFWLDFHIFALQSSTVMIHFYYFSLACCAIIYLSMPWTGILTEKGLTSNFASFCTPSPPLCASSNFLDTFLVTDWLDPSHNCSSAYNTICSSKVT